MAPAFRFIAVMALLAAAPDAVLAQSTYPTRAIRIVVPTAPGGPPDIIARLIAQELIKRWGKAVVVDARAGAGTLIGTEIVVKSPPDGYTLLMSPGTLATNPASYKKMPYDAIRDLAPITQTHLVPNVFVVHPSLPVKTVADFIALAKARPSEILYGSAGHGTNPHLTIELFASMAQIKLTHVPYKGGPPVIADLLGGRIVTTMSSTFGITLPHLRSGRLRALAVTSVARAKVLPEAPTIAETVPGFDAVQWAAFMAPAGTPAEIIERLHREIASILQTPEMRARLALEGAEPVGNTPDELGAFLRAETIKWGKAAKIAGIEPE